MTRDRNYRASTAAERMRLYRARQRGENVPLGKPGPRSVRQRPMVLAHPGAERGYALDFLSPLRHVVTELERAGRRGLTITELAAGYTHPNTGDLYRVRLLHGLDNDDQAHRFLVDRAISTLWDQVKRARVDGRYRLAVPVDAVRHDGEPIHPYRDEPNQDS
jgi:hypothetical protein